MTIQMSGKAFIVCTMKYFCLNSIVNMGLTVVPGLVIVYVLLMARYFWGSVAVKQILENCRYLLRGWSESDVLNQCIFNFI